MSFFERRSIEEKEEILALAKFIGNYNMQKGSIDERYLPYFSVPSPWRTQSAS